MTVGLAFLGGVLATAGVALLWGRLPLQRNLRDLTRRQKLVIAVVIGVLLAAIPTAFTIFPHGLGEASLPVRVTFIVVWVGIAVLAGWLAARGDYDLLDRAIRLQQQAILVSRLQNLVYPGAGGIPEDYRLTLYVPDPSGNLLIPIYPPAVNTGDPAIFQVGHGAVGEAWASDDDLRVVIGDAVSSPKHGLTPLQQKAYAPFGVVAAAVIRDEDGSPVGALTAIAHGDDSFFRSEEKAALFVRFADSLYWVLGHGTVWMLPDG